MTPFAAYCATGVAIVALVFACFYIYTTYNVMDESSPGTVSHHSYQRSRRRDVESGGTKDGGVAVLGAAGFTLATATAVATVHSHVDSISGGGCGGGGGGGGYGGSGDSGGGGYGGGGGVF